MTPPLSAPESPNVTVLVTVPEVEGLCSMHSRLLAVPVTVHVYEKVGMPPPGPVPVQVGPPVAPISVEVMVLTPCPFADPVDCSSVTVIVPLNARV